MAPAAQPMPQIPPAAPSPIHHSPPISNPSPAIRPVQTSVTAAPGMSNIPADPDDEEGLKHLEQVDLLFLNFSFACSLSENERTLNERFSSDSLSRIMKGIMCDDFKKFFIGHNLSHFVPQTAFCSV